MSKEFRALQNQISELKSRLIEVEAEIKKLKNQKLREKFRPRPLSHKCEDLDI